MLQYSLSLPDPTKKQPTTPRDRSFGLGRPSILYATPLVNYDCDKGCDVPFVLSLYYHKPAWKSMGLGQDKGQCVCRGPIGGRQVAQTFSSLVLELVVVCGRQAVKDAGVALCESLMGYQFDGDTVPL